MKKTEELRRYRTADGQEIRLPVVTLEGDRPGPRAVITAGIHGCEYPPILAATEFCRTVELSDLRGTVTVVTICTLPSFETRTPFVNPIDGKNPNRFFPGDEAGSYTECLTHHIFRDVIAGADYHLDLHCGDMTETLTPFCEFGTGCSEQVDAMSREIALYCGAPNLVESNFRQESGDLPAGLNYLNSVQHGIAAAIFEVGQMGRTDREYVEAQLFCIRNVLRRLGNLDGEAVPAAHPRYFTTYDTVSSPETGIFVRCAEPGQDLTAGQKVGEIFDYFGNRLCEVQSRSAGRILYLTSSIAVAKDGFILDMVH